METTPAVTQESPTSERIWVICGYIRYICLCNSRRNLFRNRQCDWTIARILTKLKRKMICALQTTANSRKLNSRPTVSLSRRK